MYRELIQFFSLGCSFGTNSSSWALRGSAPFLCPVPSPLPTPSRGAPENPEIKELFPFLFKVKYCGAEIPRSNKKFATIGEGK